METDVSWSLENKSAITISNSSKCQSYSSEKSENSNEIRLTRNSKKLNLSTSIPNSSVLDDNKLTEDESDEDQQENERIFSPEFKKRVLDAFENDPECLKNQRVTARKFGIHRRQVQKWLRNSDNEEPFVERNPSQFATAKELDYSLLEKFIKYSQNQKQQFNSDDSEDEIEEETSDTFEDHHNIIEKISDKKSHSDLKIETTPSEAQDLSKMSSSSMALSLNLSGNSNNNQNNVINSRNSYNTFNQFDRNNINTNLFSNTNPLLHLFPSANLYNFQLNNGIHTRSVDRQQNESPANLSTTSSSGETTPQHSSSNNNNRSALFGTNPLDVVDEISNLYPHEDFSLLRQALMRNEVTLTKLRKISPTMLKEASTFTTTLTTNENGTARRDSPSPSKRTTVSPGPGSQAFSLDLLRQQNEYLKLLQSSGMGLAFPPTNETISSIYGNSDSKYPPWFQSLAAATMGINANDNQKPESIGQTKRSSRNKPSAPAFATPKLPAAMSTSSSVIKPKTVAAALAASRTSPSQLNGTKYHETTSKCKDKLLQKKKQRSRSYHNKYDEFIDPTSMLEVVTSATSQDHSMPINSQNNLSNKETFHGVPGLATSSNPLDFLNQLLLQSPSPFIGKNKLADIPAMSLTKHYQNYEKEKATSEITDSGLMENSTSASESLSSDSMKNMVLHAFNHDNEIGGDARAIARKFGLNVRVVMKWIKEGNNITTSRQTTPTNGNGMNHSNGISPPNTQPATTPIRSNGGDHSNNGDLNNQEDITSLYYSKVTSDRKKYDISENFNNDKTELQNLLPSANNNLRKTTSNSTSTNKRKNSRPNQICDFLQDDSLNDEPVDMIVLNKMRRLNE